MPESGPGEPRFFGTDAGAHTRDTFKLEAEQKEVDAALEKVYGPKFPALPLGPPSGPHAT